MASQLPAAPGFTTDSPRGRFRTALYILGKFRVAPRGVNSDAAFFRDAGGRHSLGACERGGDHSFHRQKLLELGFVHDHGHHEARGVCS